MARKLIKRESNIENDKENANWGHVAIVICQSILMWSTIFVVVSTAYLMGIGSVAQDVSPSAVLLLLASTISIATIALLGFAAWLQTQTMSEHTLKTLSRAESWSKTFLRLTITTWMGACGLAITFMITKQPSCLLSEDRSWPSINTGSVCAVQRADIAASLFAMIVAGTLFVLVVKTRDPFRCHVFGITGEQRLLPFALPYTTKGKAMFSEMSFKCRSSSSLSSYTLVGSLEDSANSLNGLHPTRPGKAYGLGIYTPQNVQKSTMPSFLAPRPSLSTIRSNISIGSVPPPSPLPPLPAFFPKYRKSSAIPKAVHPLRRTRQPSSKKENKHGVRMVPPSSVLSIANLAAYNRSTESLSSAYSRSISGQYPHPLPALPDGLIDSKRSLSAGSTATAQRSPLAIMQLATDPERVSSANTVPRRCSESSGTEIDDAATLQAKLPNATGNREKRETHDWEARHNPPTHSGQSYHHLYSPSNALADFEKRTWTPRRRSQGAAR